MTRKHFDTKAPILIGLMIFVAMVAVAPSVMAGAEGDGLVLYLPTATGTDPTWRLVNADGTLSGTTNTLTTGLGSYAMYMFLEPSPTNSSEMILLLIDAANAADSADVKVFVFNNETQSFDGGTALTTSGPASGGGKPYISAGIAYESNSGDAMVVYGDTTNIYYRTWNGTWSAQQTYAAKSPRSVSLVGSPSSDKIMLVYVSSEAGYPVYANVWNGTGWRTEQSFGNSIFNTDLKETIVTAAAWEGASGDGMAAWIASGAAVNYANYTSSTDTWSASGYTGVSIDDSGVNKPASVYARGDRIGNHDKIALLVLDAQSKWSKANIWDGNGFGTWQTLTDNAEVDGSKPFGADMEWDNSTSGELHILTSQKTSTDLRLDNWNSTSGWTTTTLSAGGVVLKAAGVAAAKHYNSDRIRVIAEDGTGKTQYFYWNHTGGTWGSSNTISVTSTSGNPKTLEIGFFDGRNEDQAPPTYSNIGTNNTVAGYDTLFSVYWTDNIQLSAYIFGSNVTGSWVNETYYFSGLNNWSNVTKTLPGAVGTQVTWRVWANDTADNWNDTGNQTLTTTADQPPTYSNIGTNNTVAGYDTLFSVYWSDDLGLSAYIFGSNVTGSWVNETYYFSGLNNWSNVTKTLPGAVGTQVTWRVWANDTADNWNDTGNQTLTTVEDYPPTFSIFEVDSTDAGLAATFSVLWADDVALSGYIFGTNNTGIWVNESFPLSGTSAWSRTTKILNSTVGATIQWQVWANDSADNWTTIGLQQFTTTDLAGRFITSRNLVTGIDLEDSAATSCYQAGYGSSYGGCHMISYPFNGSTDGNGPDIIVTNIIGVTHPGENRTPAGFYPDFVHGQHGGVAWPLWETSKSNKEGGGSVGVPCGDEPNITTPCIGTLYSGSGKTDNDIGDGTGLDLGFNRTRFSGTDTNYQTDPDMVDFIAAPWAKNDKKPEGLGGCAYGTQAREPGGSRYSGCHGIADDWKDANNWVVSNRTDQITCDQCHTSITVSSTNTKHNVETGAKCDNCHQAYYNTTTLKYELGNGTIPSVQYCDKCHSGVITPLNTSGAHVGKDCRYCHGHPHNATRELTWNTTCGNTDSVCHGATAAEPRNVSIANHSVGTVTGPDCGDCHKEQSAHNITVPTCSKCHNATSTWGNATAPRAVPNWDTYNNIYHGNASLGVRGGLNCTYCHEDPATGKLPFHYLNVTGKPTCLDNRCHGDSTSTNATYIPSPHASNVTGSTPLECTDCHNNATMTYNVSLFNINTNLHSTRPDWMIPFNITTGQEMTSDQCRYCHNDTDAFGGLDCADCHSTSNGTSTALRVHNDTMNQATASIDFDHQAGGPDCVSCHYVGSSDPNINYTAMKLSVHRYLNQDAANTTYLTDEIDKACWGCHQSNGSEPSAMGDRFKDPYTCYECHNATKPYDNVSSAPTVSEHFKGGTDIQAATDNTTNISSCKECHNKWEMILTSNDPDTGTFDADGDGIYGGAQNFYHYGRNRTDIYGGFPATTTCEYCHQNTTTAFESAMDVNATYHKDMLNHTDRTSGPACTDSSCHGPGRIHDSTLTKPATLYDNSYCTGCHFGLGQKEVHANSGPNANNLFCADCHTDPAAYPYEKQIHGIRYIQKNLTYSGAWDNSSYADCTSCHQQTGTIVNINNTAPPQIPANFNHSDNASAGSIWNTTSDGYFGPWNVSGAGSNLRACLYCHGTVSKAATDPANIGNIIHNSSALGRVNLSYSGQNEVNGTINETSSWCGSCHDPSNAYYNDMMADFDSAGFERPPNNQNYTDADGGFNHTSSINSANDTRCANSNCHGDLLSSDAKMDEFAHNVRYGSSMSNCAACHDQGGGVDRLIDIATFNRSDIDEGENIGRLSENRTLHGDINQDDVSNNSDCQICHWNTSGMGAGWAVDTNTSSPTFNTYYCTTCHLVPTNTSGTYLTNPDFGKPLDKPNVTWIGNPPDLYTHAPAKTRLRYDYLPGRSETNVWVQFANRTLQCEVCHNNSVEPSNDASIQSALENVSHYGKYTNLTTIGTPDRNTTSCPICHRDLGTIETERALWGIGTTSDEGYVKDVNMGSNDPTTCYTCHIASNYNKNPSETMVGPSNFHRGPVDAFMYNCGLCHLG